MTQSSNVVGKQTEGGVELSFEESIYPRDAIFGAAYTLLDRCFVHLDRDGTRLLVKLRPKAGVTVEAAQLAGEFEAEALAQSWRREIIAENRALIEGVTARAFGGAAGAPSLDDLLGEDLGDLGDAFDDPLGIAVSWEEKYGKKDEVAPTQEPTAADAASAEEPASTAGQGTAPKEQGEPKP